MITIDGSYLEGGGQIARTALALSTLTQQPFEINNIRKNRPKPGLKAQHLSCVNALQELSGAKATGAEIGSKQLQFFPSPVQSRTLSIDIGTAGSITLLLQCLIPPIIFAERKVRLKITGGTSVSWSPQVEYFSNVLLPQLKKYCNNIDFKLLRRGYYPKGAGKIDLVVKPKYTHSEELPKIDLLRQYQLAYIKGVSHASSDLQKGEVAERQARAAKAALSQLGNVSIRAEYSDTLSTGSGIVLWAVFSERDEVSMENPVIVGADSLGAKGKRAESVGTEAANNLLREINSKSPVDKHLADQLLPFMALAGNSSIKTSEITNHAKTNIYVIEKFLGKKFSVNESSNIINIS